MIPASSGGLSSSIIFVFLTLVVCISMSDRASSRNYICISYTKYASMVISLCKESFFFFLLLYVRMRSEDKDGWQRRAKNMINWLVNKHYT